MNVLLIDDEPSNNENIKALLQTYCPQVRVIAQATSVETALSLIHHQRPDVLFLDIHLGEHSGFDLLRLLPDKSFEVIFVTAFDQYGIEAVKFAALDYLLKPVAIAELVAAVSKAEGKLHNRQKNEQLAFLLNQLTSTAKAPVKIALPQQHEIRYVEVHDIIRCEADNSYTFFYLNGGERVLVCRSIKEYTELLQPAGFIRSHQSHLVNCAFVKSWLREDGGTLLLENRDKVPVSRPNRDRVLRALENNQ